MSEEQRTFESVWDCLPSGWLSLEEAKLLWDTVRNTTGDILEVGCYRGRSTVLLALSNTSKTVYGVDPYNGFDKDLDGQKGVQTILNNLEERKILNVTLSITTIELWEPRSVGFCYLDGSHTYQGTVNQILKAKQCTPQSIAIHDVNDSGDGLEVQHAAVNYLGTWDIRVERLAIWYKRAQKEW